LNQPEEWIKLGLWRWLTPASAKKRIARHVQGYTIDWRDEYRRRLLASSVNLAPIAKTQDGDGSRLVFNRKVVRDEYKSVLRVNAEGLGFSYREGDGGIEISTPNTNIIIKEERVDAKPFALGESLEDLVDVLKIIYRMYGCVKCGSCVLWVPRGCARLTPQGPVLENKVDEKDRRQYLESCPISDQLVEKVVVPLILDNPKAFKRPSRKRLKFQ